MQIKRLWRSLVSYGVVAALALQLFGVFTPSTTHAAGPYSLRFTEINWAGSQNQPTDQWMELQNVSGAPIDFGDTPFTVDKVVGASEVVMATLDTGVLPTDAFLVLTREAVPSANSTLAGVPSSTAIYMQETNLILPSVATAYRLYDNTPALADSIDDPGTGVIPFAGSSGSTTMPIASMSRVIPSDDGNLPGSWYTSGSMGINFISTSPEQLGTPGEGNIEVPVPAHIAIAPVDSTNTSSLPTITGTIPAGVDSVKATFTRKSFTPSPYSRTYDATITAGSFTVTPTDGEDSIAPGRYLVDLTAYDAAGDRSFTVHVLVAPDTTEANYVILPTSSSVPAPMLDPYPVATNQTTLTVTGWTNTESNAYNSIEILRNNRYHTTVTMNPDGHTFSATVTLLPNMVNTFEFVAVNSFGDLSLPTTAAITQDSIAPLAIHGIIHANPPGTNDTVEGLPGAAEPGTHLWVFGDAALTQQIVSATIAPDGSFPQLSIGDNLYNRVYLIVKDDAANVSPVQVLDNPTGYVAGSADGLNVTVSGITDTQANVGWSAVTGAAHYHVKYKAVNSTYGSVFSVCPNGNSGCSLQMIVVNLQPNTSYVVAVAVVDTFGNESPYKETTFQTKTIPVVAPVVPPTPPVVTTVASTTPITGGTDNIQNDTTPTPSPSPESGDVKSANTDTTRNWTPWIILLILIGIAILATAGYFYWFGGEAGDAILLGAADDDDEKDGDGPPTKPTTRRSTTSSPPKKPDKEKRW